MHANGQVRSATSGHWTASIPRILHPEDRWMYRFTHKNRKLYHIIFLCANVSKFRAQNARSLTFPTMTCDPAVLFRTLYYNNLEIKTRRCEQDMIGIICALRHSIFCALRSDNWNNETHSVQRCFCVLPFPREFRQWNDQLNLYNHIIFH